MNKNPYEIIKELENLQTNLKNCQDDKKALELQKKVVDLLSKTLKDQELIKSIMKNKKTKE